MKINKAIKYNFYIVICVMFVYAFNFSSAYAVICSNTSGSAGTVTFDLDSAIESANNSIGSTVDISKSSIGGVYAKCSFSGLTQIPTYRSYLTSFDIIETIDSYQFLKINDYIEGAMSITDAEAGTFYPPVNYQRMGTIRDVALGKEFEVKDTSLIFRLKVTRKIIGTLIIPDTQLFTVYVTTKTSDSLATPVYYINISGSIDVPQTCEVNAGDIIDIDFGKISAAAFSAAGAGNKPEGALIKKTSLNIDCDNINTSSLLKLRIEADKASGNAIIANNSDDIGFLISDSNEKVLTPNDLTSVTNVSLDDSGTATVAINAWPISVTGKAPEPGEYQATGYIRIDYE